MKRVRYIWKVLLVFVAAVMIPLVLMGCGKGDKKEAPDKTPTEHPTDDHPTSEHPTGEHPR